MAAAARGSSRPVPPDIELTARRAAPGVRAESKRPIPYPEPLNDNSDDDGLDDIRQAPRTSRRRLNFLQIVARIVIAPLYIAVGIGAVAIIALFARGFLA